MGEPILSVIQELMLSKRSKRQCESKAVAKLFGAPPILPGEDPKTYQEMLVAWPLISDRAILLRRFGSTI